MLETNPYIMSDNNLIQIRKDKIQLWEELGYEGYARTYDRTHKVSDLSTEIEGKELRSPKDIMSDCKNEISICGRIMNAREMGKLAFLKIRDVSGDFQVCLAQDVLGDNFKTWLKALDLGDFAGFRGECFLTKHGEKSLMAAEITPLAKSIRPLPEKWKGLQDKEACYRERNLDLMTNTETFDRFKKRSQIVRMIRDFFHDKNFHEVETRTLQPQAGGAMAKVFETHHNALDHDFVLRIALELDLKMACSGGFERVFEIGKNFRNEGTDPSHLQEFTMLEWYGAYDTLEMHEQWIEILLRKVCTEIFGKTLFELLDKEDKPVSVDFSKSFGKVTFAELLAKYANIDMFAASMEELRDKALALGIDDVETRGRGNLLDDIYKKTARPNLIQPTFVVDWPSDLKPLARPHGNGSSAASQLLIAGWEVTNGYGELIDPEIQRQLLEEQQNAKNAGDDEAMELDEEFLKAMEHGFPPMAGNAIGIDRIVALLTGQPNLRDVVLFPTMKPEKQAMSAKEAETLYKSKKIVVIADESLPYGVTANAMGQLGVAIGGHSKQKLFEAKTLTDKDGRIHYTDSLYPMANLSGSRAKMAEFMQKCYDAEIQCFDFSDVMRKAHTDAQMQKGYAASGTKDIGYIAVGALIPADFEKEFISTLALFGGGVQEPEPEETLPADEEKKSTINWDTMPDEGGKRFIAVLNKKIPTGKLFNALGHITAGMAANYPEINELCFLPYEDADGGAHPNISHYPFIALKADNGNKIRKVRQEAIDRGVVFGDFTESMTIGSSKEQVENTKNTKEEDLEYFGVVLFGDTTELREFTGKFSLFQ